MVETLLRVTRAAFLALRCEDARRVPFVDRALCLREQQHG